MASTNVRLAQAVIDHINWKELEYDIVHDQVKNPVDTVEYLALLVMLEESGSVWFNGRCYTGFSNTLTNDFKNWAEALKTSLA